MAGIPGLVAALIRLWLCTAETVVAQKAEQVLLDLLGVEENYKIRSEKIHPNLIWRRVFRDRDVYGSIFSICSLTTIGEEGQPSKREKTIAQARLLNLLAKIDYDSMRSSQLPAVEAKYGVQDGGLLKFAALQMVDFQGDVLIHMVLMEFFTNLLRRKSLLPLDFLLENGLHSRTLSYYVEPENVSPLDLNFLYGQSAIYISVYCSTFAAHLFTQRLTLNSILLRVSNALRSVSRVNREWQISKHDLQVLVSLPRILLLPQNLEHTPFFHLYSKPGDAAVYNTLAAVFQDTKEKSAPDSLSSAPIAENEFISGEILVARVLYYLYLKKYPFFWEEIVKDADIVALQDVALAAIGLMKTIIMANWDSLPTEPERNWPTLPTEKDLAKACLSENQDLPTSGFEALFADGGWEIVVKYLLRSSPAFDNLVGGRGDTDSAAYRVAMAKHDLSVLFYQKLKPMAQEKGGLNDVVDALQIRALQGPRGGLPEIRPTVATLEL